MLTFTSLTPADRDMVHSILYTSHQRSCEYSFANLFLWGRQQVTRMDGYLLVFSHFGGKSVYLYPAGSGPIEPVLEALREDAAQRGIPFRLTGLSQEDVQTVQSLYPDRFHFTPLRDSFDYLYEIDRLADLKGRKLQQKRNHIHRFEEACPGWRTEPLTPALLAACQTMCEEWYRSHLQENNHVSYRLEQVAIARAFQYYDALGMDGLVLLDGEKILAFTMGNPISPDTYDVNFEKAYADIPGCYPIINREFARYIREKNPEIRYLNREDDMGLPGLRKAKESYLPDILLEKNLAVLWEECDGSCCR